MKPIKEIEYKNHRIKIFQDDTPFNPREEFERLGTMVCFHKRHKLGDEHDFCDTEDFKDFLKKYKKTIIKLPIYLYDHSGLLVQTYPFNDPWDSGLLGYSYTSYEKIKKYMDWKKITKKRIEKVKRMLQSEIKEYNSYLNNEVYGYTLEKIEEEEKENEEIDSCWGFIGDLEDSVLSCMKDQIDSVIG